MEIERINENTIKFYISYGDIEDRGFEREEIWYNRERSEQLFWQMMDEVNYKEDFNVEGPLWIQVQAMEKGLEIMVTKAQISKSGEKLELPTDEGSIDVSIDDKMESILEEKFGSNDKNKTDEENSREDNLWIIVSFDDFEYVIQLSHYIDDSQTSVRSSLYHHKDKYYLYVEFFEDMDDDYVQENIISQVLEFADDSDVTLHVLEEYGKVVFANDTFAQVRTYFPV
ncbi:adaptor protein MecA [Virgibacillus sp. MSJ-26]|uniref:adaptor protein MecA n=1 Tax=Virgibacillus sp. MSJ-26 TaxID=2841522 RepID=UPI001C10FC7C|nr:adaptor protein MecA [Virgibacillus sp. MSJ-26]MBU5468521.1 adaptor protein MecA [Virgibacillus sp. MSJ-26]